MSVNEIEFEYFQKVARKEFKKLHSSGEISKTANLLQIEMEERWPQIKEDVSITDHTPTIKLKRRPKSNSLSLPLKNMQENQEKILISPIIVLNNEENQPIIQSEDVKPQEIIHNGSIKMTSYKKQKRYSLHAPEEQTAFQNKY